MNKFNFLLKKLLRQFLLLFLFVDGHYIMHEFLIRCFHLRQGFHPHTADFETKLIPFEVKTNKFSFCRIQFAQHLFLKTFFCLKLHVLSTIQFPS